jgi:peptidoglycan/xylan/chitin deacetylase (PgdA/CDA1 family)
VNWPEGAASAVCLTFDFDVDEVWRAEIPDAANRPNLLSQGMYGLRALPLVLDRLRARGLPATFFVPGRVAERFPDEVRAIAAEGHELAHHGYTHRNPAGLSPEEEREELSRGLDALGGLGLEIKGYRAPAWDTTASTSRLLDEFGFLYASNDMADIVPYRHEDGGVIELPAHWILDDAAHFWFSQQSFSRKISTNGEVAEIWLAEARGIARLGGVCVHTFHPQVIGRPGRLELLDRILDFVAGQEGVWVAKGIEIVEWAGPRL